MHRFRQKTLQLVLSDGPVVCNKMSQLGFCIYIDFRVVHIDMTWVLVAVSTPGQKFVELFALRLPQTTT